MSGQNATDPSGLIGGQYLVDVTRPLPDGGGGIQAFAASGRGSNTEPLMALRVDRYAPARPRAVHSLMAGFEGLLTPLAQGVGPSIDGQPAWFIICQAPPGPSLATSLRPWPEHAIIEFVMRPIAAVLEQLQTRGLTHRGIRPNNVFLGAPNRPVVLGACWAAPPAMHQPALYETVYTAVCHRAGRGDGRISDDVYALGVLLVTLALGRQPMEGLDDNTVMNRKFEFGDYTAIAGTERLTPMLSDIIRGMLAEDPDHRPPPTLLRDPAGARGRRVAARPASRAQRSLKLGTSTVWNSRTLALAMAREPDEAATAILSGTMMYWVRRGLGDSALAVKLEDLVRQCTADMSTDKETAQAMMVMRAVMVADIFMPLCWRGLAMFPDGLGPTLAANPTVDPALQRKLIEIVVTEAQGIWGMMREERTPAAPHRLDARQRRAILQIKGPAGGLPRLSYTLNPQTPCASALLSGRWIVSVGDLAVALNAVAATTPGAELLEPQIAAFIGARSERQLDQEVKDLAANTDSAEGVLSALRLLSELQVRYHPAPMAGLTAWVAARAQPLVDRWQNRERRAAVDEHLKSLVAPGLLKLILALLEDGPGHAADTEGLRMARANLLRLDAELKDIAQGSVGRASLAGRLGQEIAAGLGVAALACTLILAAMG